MKRLFLILALLVSIFSIDASAFVRYVTTNLNLRYGPSSSYKIIGTIPKGTAVTIEEDCDCKWVPVEYKGKVGYISTRYLSSYPQRKSNQSQRTTVRNTRKSYSNSGRVHYYTNSYGNRVQSPTRYDSRPAGATALCRDGTYSFSQSRRGTCSHHGGVARWY